MRELVDRESGYQGDGKGQDFFKRTIEQELFLTVKPKDFGSRHSIRKGAVSAATSEVLGCNFRARL
jgi:hypothetical protein